MTVQVQWQAFFSSRVVLLPVSVMAAIGLIAMISLARIPQDSSFFVLCQNIQREYVVDVQEGLVDIQCSPRRWWYVSVGFRSHQQLEYFAALQATQQLEASRQEETQALQNQAAILSQQLVGLRGEGQAEDMSTLLFRQAEAQVNQLQPEVDVAQAELRADIDFISERLEIYPHSSSEFVAFVADFQQKNKVDQAIQAKTFRQEWAVERERWIKKLYEVKTFTQSLTYQQFTELFDIVPVYSAAAFAEAGDAVTRAETSPVSVTVFETAAANQYALRFAQARGYQFRQMHDGNLKGIEEEKLPTNVANAFVAMQQAAQEDGVILTLTSGFRGVDAQAQIFFERFEANAKTLGVPYSAADIQSGQSDAALEKTFEVTALPGTSKHHTGRAVDIGDGLPESKGIGFSNTPAYQWLSEYNFLNAKRFGFVPSYPVGVQQIGPNPESWEYVFVE